MSKFEDLDILRSSQRYLSGLQRISCYRGYQDKHIIGYFFEKLIADQAAARIALELGVSIQVLRIKMDTISIVENISDTVIEFDEEGIRLENF